MLIGGVTLVGQVRTIKSEGVRISRMPYEITPLVVTMCAELQTLPGCRFADELHGRWRTFNDVITDRSRDFRSTRDLDIDSDRIQTVSQDGSAVTSAVRWVCKSRHWQQPYYQVLVVRNNGWYYCYCYYY